MTESDLRWHRGDYGPDGSFGRLPAPVQAIGAGGLVLGLAGAATASFARGRRRQRMIAAALAAWVLETGTLYLHAARAGKFAGVGSPSRSAFARRRRDVRLRPGGPLVWPRQDHHPPPR